jgi:hypothetical protein
MSHNPTILDLISASQSQKEVTANALFDAASPATIFGRRATTSTGLTWGYYGGAFWNGAALTTVADGTVALTASATNYVYATSAGVVTVTTSAPTGWPSTLASGAIPLYQLSVNSAGPTAWTDYRVAGSNLPPTTITNIINTTVISQSITSTGQPKSGLTKWRTMEWTIGSALASGYQVPPGSWSTSGAPSSSVATLDFSNSIKSVPRANLISSAVAGSTMQITSDTILWALSSTIPTGGGFNFIALANISVSVAGMRCFHGMVNPAATNVDPSTMFNMIGFGADTGDTNMQFMQNDGSGVATKTDLGANFPARSSGTDLYLMQINAAPGQTSSVDWAITNFATSGSVFSASGTVTTNLPTANTRLGVRMSWNNAATAAAFTVEPARVSIQSNY